MIAGLPEAGQDKDSLEFTHLLYGYGNSRGRFYFFDKSVGVEKGSGLRFLLWQERALPAPPKGPDLSTPIFVVSATVLAPEARVLDSGVNI